MARSRIPGWKYDAASGHGVIRVKVRDAAGHWRLVQRSIRERDPRRAEARALEARADILKNPPDPGRQRQQGEAGGVTLEMMAAYDIKETSQRGLDDAHVKARRSKWRVTLRFADPDTLITAIGYDWARAYEGRRRAAGVAGQTIVREFQLIKSALRIAKRQGKLVALPDEWPSVRRDPADPQRKGKLRSPEMIAEYIRRLNGEARDEVEIDAVTGIRGGGELKRLEAGWIEPAPKGAVVPAIIRIPARAAKNRRERVIGCPQRALDIIKRRIEEGCKERIFSKESHRTHRRRVWRDVCKVFGVPELPRITMRDLRHTYATLAMQRSGDPAAVMAALGHRDLSTTQLYLSAPLERTAQLGAGVEAELGPALEPIETTVGAAKLTSTQVEDARRRHATGETLKAISESLGVHLSTVGKAIARHPGMTKTGMTATRQEKET